MFVLRGHRLSGESDPLNVIGELLQVLLGLLDDGTVPFNEKVQDG
jgi:hypothetical protein